MRLRRLMVLALAFWMVGALIPTLASASDFRLRIEDANTGNGIVITDEQLGDEAIGQQGVVSLTVFGLGGADTSLTMGLSKPVVFDPTALSYLFLNSITMNSSGPAKLILTLEDAGYSSVPTNLQLTSHVFDGLFTAPDGTSNAPAGSSITVRSWVNTSNTAPDLGADTGGAVAALPAIGSIAGTGTPTQVYTDGATSFGSDTSSLFVSSGSYSLFTQVLIDLTGGANLQFQQEARVDAAPGAIDGPEPASLMLISMGVLGLAGARRRFMPNLA